jgi:hypothetical protein
MSEQESSKPMATKNTDGSSEFNTGDDDLDGLLGFAFDMGANRRMNMDCGIYFMERLDSLKARLRPADETKS